VTRPAVNAGAVEVAGLRLAVEEHGSGPPVLLVHGAGTGRTLWRETVTALEEGRARAIAYDRRAYGESESPEPYTGTTVGEQAEDAGAVIDALGMAPAVVCGHDLGALVALDLLLRHRPLVRAAVLIEPPLFALSPVGPEWTAKLREAIEEGAREGGPPGGFDAYLAHVAGSAAFDVLGADRVETGRSAALGMVADLAAAPAWSFSRRELRGLDAPLVVMTGARSAAIRRGVGRSVAELVEGAELREPDAGHLVPIEAPGDVAAAIAELAAR
jgi:3-oxoadipate enol-lactonase